MANVLIVVEGAHDAAFIGVLLNERGYTMVEEVSDLPQVWQPLIPRAFPATNRLSHVVAYPDVYRHPTEAHSIAIKTAGSVAQLTSELRAAVEILRLSELHTIAMFADADTSQAEAQFAKLSNALSALNRVAADDSLDGFPLAIPQQPGEFASGSPRVGIYLFPDNEKAGTLETLLLECGAHLMPTICEPASGFVRSIDTSHHPEDNRLKRLRKGAGRDKAVAGVIANVNWPGSSLAVALTKSDWLTKPEEKDLAIERVRSFIRDLLPH